MKTIGKPCNLKKSFALWGVLCVIASWSAVGARAQEGVASTTPNTEATPKPKDWTEGTGIGIVLDSEGKPAVDEDRHRVVNGRMTEPQDQTRDSYEPTKVIVKVGDELDCSVEEATDMDHWTQDDNDGDDTNNNVYGEDFGDSGDGVNYTWSGGPFKVGTNPDGTPQIAMTASGAGATFAPSEPGKYTLTCTIDDTPTPVESPETSDDQRDDTAVVRTVEVIAYQVVIYTNGERVDRGFRLRAGQVVNLRGTVEPEGELSLSNPNWNIGGDTIKDWVRTLTQGYTVPTQLDGFSTSFCWYNGGAASVTFNVVVEGNSKSRAVPVAVAKPSAELIAVARNSYVAGNGSSALLTKGGDQYGIEFSASPNIADVLYYWVQTGVSTRVWSFEGGQQVPVLPGTNIPNPDIQYGLDNRFPYSSQAGPPFFEVDSPNIGMPALTPPIVGVSVSDVYHMCFMNLPPIRNSNYGVIPVPVATVLWHWVAHAERPGGSAPWPTGAASRGGGTSSITDSSDIDPTNPKAKEPSDSQPNPAYPTWSSRIVNRNQ